MQTVIDEELAYLVRWEMIIFMWMHRFEEEKRRPIYIDMQKRIVRF